MLLVTDATRVETGDATQELAIDAAHRYYSQRTRFHSDKNVAVLSHQSTVAKDRRFYTVLLRIISVYGCELARLGGCELAKGEWLMVEMNGG